MFVLLSLVYFLLLNDVCFFVWVFQYLHYSGVCPDRIVFKLYLDLLYYLPNEHVDLVISVMYIMFMICV